MVDTLKTENIEKGYAGFIMSTISNFVLDPKIFDKRTLKNLILANIGEDNLLSIYKGLKEA